MIGPWEVFSLLSFFPVLSLDHARVLHLALEGSQGVGSPNFASFESSSCKLDFIAPGEGTGRMGGLVFGLMGTCCRVAVGVWTGAWAFKILRLILGQLWSDILDQMCLRIG